RETMTVSSTSSAFSAPGFELDPTKTTEEYIKGSNSFITVGNAANTTINLNASGGTPNRGGGESVSVRDPNLGMHYIIALQGVFPSRN
ncbi:MAG: hypothetical protein AAF597_11115, partial [Bacteroidota bacterium]